MIEIILNIVAIAGFLSFVFLFFRFRQNRRTEELQLNIDTKVLQAIKIASFHGAISKDLLRRQMKITAKEAGEIIMQLKQGGILKDESRNGISEVV